MGNTDISRLLGEMWRNFSEREKAPYVEQELKERAIYKEEIKKWRDEQARVDAASRTSHKSVQEMAEYPPLQGYAEVTPPNYEFTRIDTVEEAANKADHRMLFRPSYSAQYSSHRPSYGKYNTCLIHCSSGFIYSALTQNDCFSAFRGIPPLPCSSS